MNAPDIMVLISVIFTLATLLASVLQIREKPYALTLLLAFSALIFGSFMEGVILTQALIFGLIAGTMQSLADCYLVKKTLTYQKNAIRLLYTPWWMVMLWGIALTQISYAYLRLLEASGSNPIVVPIIFVVGSAYFYVFELLVNNCTTWWQRSNCYQPLGVALYATLSEIATILIIIIFLPEMGESVLKNILVGITSGAAIASIFLLGCVSCYKKD